MIKARHATDEEAQDSQNLSRQKRVKKTTKRSYHPNE